MHRSFQKSKSDESAIPESYIQFPKEPITLDRLPLRIGKNISIECYNTYLTDRESTAYKLKREKNGEVFIIEMPSKVHEIIARHIDTYFKLANGANPVYRYPIAILGSTYHKSPTHGHKLEPDSSYAPFYSLVQARPPGGYPGLPPGDYDGGPYARIVCEIGSFQSASSLWERCEEWIRQPYVRYVIGIKLYGPRTSRNALGQRNRSMMVRVWWQPGAPPPMHPALVPVPPLPQALAYGPMPLVPGDAIPGAAPPPEPQFYEWEFGTHFSGVDLPTGCIAPGLPQYQIQLSSSEVFWDPPLPIPPTIPTVPAGYMATIPPLIPAGFLPIAPFINIDLYDIRELVLNMQNNDF